MLIEDEILLSLPSSPRHNEGECSIAGLEGRGIAREKPARRIGGTEKIALNLLRSSYGSPTKQKISVQAGHASLA